MYRAVYTIHIETGRRQKTGLDKKGHVLKREGTFKGLGKEGFYADHFGTHTRQVQWLRFKKTDDDNSNSEDDGDDDNEGYDKKAADDDYMKKDNNNNRIYVAPTSVSCIDPIFLSSKLSSF